MATCVVSGTLVNVSEVAISGATVRAYAVSPFISGTNFVTNGVVGTTTASDGTWSLTLTRTAAAAITPARTVTIEFEYTDGTLGLVKEQYAITVPNSSTAAFTSLITLL